MSTAADGEERLSRACSTGLISHRGYIGSIVVRWLVQLLERFGCGIFPVML